MSNSAETREQRINEDEKLGRESSRTAFEVDHDRILYSVSLRRLNGVSQIASADKGRQFHNRHTHSGKVAQIAHRIAQEIERGKGKRRGLEDYINDLGGLDPEVARTAGLAHDLGTPPFGHNGERVLNRLVQDACDFDGFEGNAQTFRLVSKLETHKKDDGYGLNLTRSTLRAVLKYPWLPEDDRSKGEKWGAYNLDKEAFDFAMELEVEDGGREKGRKGLSLEAEIMDWADDIANAVHDVEDYYRYGMIPLDRIRKDKDYANGLFEKYFCGHEERKQYRDAWDKLKEIFPEDPFDSSKRGAACIYKFRSDLIGNFSNKFFFLDCDANLIWRDPNSQRQVKILKKLASELVIDSEELEIKQAGEARMVEFVFGHCFEALNNGRSKFMGVQEGQPDQLSPQRIIADYISSRSEKEIRQMYRSAHGLTGARA